MDVIDKRASAQPEPRHVRRRPDGARIALDDKQQAEEYMDALEEKELRLMLLNSMYEDMLFDALALGELVVSSGVIAAAAAAQDCAKTLRVRCLQIIASENEAWGETSTPSLNVATFLLNTDHATSAWLGLLPVPRMQVGTGAFVPRPAIGMPGSMLSTQDGMTFGVDRTAWRKLALTNGDQNYACVFCKTCCLAGMMRAHRCREMAVQFDLHRTTIAREAL